MLNPDFSRMALLSSISVMLSGCGFHRLAQGEPDFNTSQLLARQVDVKAPDSLTITAATGTKITAKNGTEVTATAGTTINTPDDATITAKDGTAIVVAAGTTITAADTTVIKATDGTTIVAGPGTTITKTIGATHKQGLVTVQAVAGDNTPHGGAFYRTFLAWADPSAPPAAPVASDSSGKLITLQIPLACNNADQAEAQTTDPDAPPEPVAASPAASDPGDAAGQKVAEAGDKPATPSPDKPKKKGTPDSTPAEPSPALSKKTGTHSKGYAATKACYYALKSEIDQSYLAYMITLLHTVSYGNAAADITTEGLDLASSVTGVKSAKTILSAISTGIGASKTAIEKDVLYDEEMTIIVNQMEKDRAKSSAITATALNDETADNPYTISQVYNDLMGYYIDGTFSHALQELKSNTGAAKTNCQNAANQAKLGGTTGKAAGQNAAASTTCSTSTTSTSGTGSIGLTADVLTTKITLSDKNNPPAITVKISEISDAKVEIKLDPVTVKNVAALSVFGSKVAAADPAEVKKQTVAADKDTVVFTLKSLTKNEVGETITVTATGYSADGTVTGTKQLGKVLVSQ